MTTEIKVPLGYGVTSGVGPLYADVKLVVVDNGTLTLHRDDGSVTLFAPGGWKRIDIVKDESYVPPEPVAEPEDEPELEFPTPTEPEGGWLQGREKYLEILRTYDGVPRALWNRLRDAGFPIAAIDEDFTSDAERDDMLWARISELAEKFEPIQVEPSADVEIVDDL